MAKRRGDLGIHDSSVSQLQYTAGPARRRTLNVEINLLAVDVDVKGSGSSSSTGPDLTNWSRVRGKGRESKNGTERPAG